MVLEIDAHVELRHLEGFHDGGPRTHPPGRHEHRFCVSDLRRVLPKEGLDAVLYGKSRRSLLFEKGSYLRMTTLAVKKAILVPTALPRYSGGEGLFQAGKLACSPASSQTISTSAPDGREWRSSFSSTLQAIKIVGTVSPSCSVRLYGLLPALSEVRKRPDLLDFEGDRRMHHVRGSLSGLCPELGFQAVEIPPEVWQSVILR